MIQAPDLLTQFPRSPAELLGGFVILARCIDKCRATIAGANGEYHFNCPLDQQFFGLTKIDAEAFKSFVAQGKSDEEILSWVKQRTAKLTEDEILAWGYDQAHRGPESVDQKAYFEGTRRTVAPNKPYISSWFQLLDAEEGRL
jgi:hypothetical protein